MIARLEGARRWLAVAPLLLAVVAPVSPLGAQGATRDPASAEARVTVVVLPFQLAIPDPPVRVVPVVAPRPPMRGGPLSPPGSWGRTPGTSRLDAGAPHGPHEGGEAPSVMPALPASDDATDRAGVAVADLLTDRLLASGRFRVLDARQLEALRRRACDPAGKPPCTHATRAPRAGELYLIAGSITRMGRDERSVGAGGLVHGVLGALGVRRDRTQVTLAARLVDAATGEVVRSATVAGISTKGGGIAVGGLGHGAGGGLVLGGRAADAATAQALDRAVRALADSLSAESMLPRQGSAR